MTLCSPKNQTDSKARVSGVVEKEKRQEGKREREREREREMDLRKGKRQIPRSGINHE